MGRGGEGALVACLLPPYAEVLTLEVHFFAQNVRLALDLMLALKCPAPRLHRGHGPGLWGLFMGGVDVLACWRVVIVSVVRCIACAAKVSLRRQAARRALKLFEFWWLEVGRWRYSPERGLGRFAGCRSKD